MADGITFLQNMPIGRTASGELVYPDQTFWLNINALTNRTGGFAKNFIADALAAAANAEITADGKITSVFQNNPPPVGDFDEGDLWFDTNDGNKVYQLRSGVWVNAQDSAIGTAIGAAADAQATADGKVVTFFQASQPTAGEIGDLWHDTDDPQRRTYRWNGSVWQDIADKTPFNVAAAILGQGLLATKNFIVYSQTSPPVGANVGDLWFDTDDPQRRIFRWSGSAWVHVSDQTAFNVAAAFLGQGALATLNNVNTANVVNNAITAASNASTAGSVSLNKLTYTELQSITLSTQGGPVDVSASFQIAGQTTTPVSFGLSSSIAFRIERDSTIIATGQDAQMPLTGSSVASAACTVTAGVIDNPAPGTYIYKISALDIVITNTTNLAASTRFLRAIEFKR